MTRSSWAVRPVSFFASTSTPSSSRMASSSSVNPLATGSLRLHACKEGHTLGHALFPRIGRSDRGQAPAILFELQSPLRKLAGFLDREGDALRRNRCRHLFQAVLAH